MGKAFEALVNAAKEGGGKSGVPPLTPVREEKKPSFSTPADGLGPEVPAQPKQQNLELRPEPVKRYLRPEMPSIPPRLNGFKRVSIAVEEYHKMKYKIFNFNAGKTIKTILFCSANRNEGNSTVFLNFGQILAAKGYRVLLVDSNLHHPSLHQLFHLRKENGLSDVCLETGNLESLHKMIKRTPLDNLRVITSGNSDVHPGSIFESEFFDALIEQIKMQADWVLFDSPALNSSGDAIALAGKVDGVVLVVEAEKTRWEVAQECKRRLEKTGAHILGFVLNKRRFHIPRWLYKTL